jgi:hypothetical protein
MQLVQVTNNGPEAIVVQFDRQKYTLKPGLPKFVPYDACLAFFGDPNSKDDSERNIRDRAEEFLRVRFVWGNHGQDTNEQHPLPKVSFIDPETEVELNFVINDPDGSNVVPEADTDLLATSRIVALEEQIRRLTMQMDMARDESTKTTPAESASGPVMPEDTKKDESTIAESDKVDDDSGVVATPGVNAPARKDGPRVGTR